LGEEGKTKAVVAWVLRFEERHQQYPTATPVLALRRGEWGGNIGERRAPSKPPTPPCAPVGDDLTVTSAAREAVSKIDQTFCQREKGKKQSKRQT
jgi:hypothetical protein